MSIRDLDNRNLYTIKHTEEIVEVLNAAVIKNRTVSIQKEERNAEGYYPNNIVCKILGSDELGIYVGKNKIHYDKIRHIDFTRVINGVD